MFLVFCRWTCRRVECMSEVGGEGRGYSLIYHVLSTSSVKVLLP